MPEDTEDAGGQMRGMAAVVTALILVAAAGPAEARERSLRDLPKDVWDLAFVWTEPIKQVAKETRRFDPVSGLWFGMLEGSLKSFQRTADFFLQDDTQPARPPAQSGTPLLRYNF